MKGLLDEVAKAGPAFPPMPREIAGTADVERETKLDAERVTLEFATKSTRPVDAGRSIEDSPLFGGDRQEKMF